MKWESENIFTCRLSRRDFRILRRSAKKLDCSLTVVEREGVPFFLGRLRRRHALLAGALLCGGLLLWGSFFIWDFTVEGNRRVTEEEILRRWRKTAWDWGPSASGWIQRTSATTCCWTSGAGMDHGAGLRLPGHGRGPGAG